MTRSGVGRSRRTASRLAYAPVTGVGPGGLPAIQGVPERVTVRAGRVAVGLGLRTVVVAGFAGAAWLLCANAAQAADAPATDRTAGLSAVDLRATGSGGAGGSPAPGRAASISELPLADAPTSAHQPIVGAASALLTGAADASVEPSSVPPASDVAAEPQPLPPLTDTATSVVLPSTTATSTTPIASPALPAGAKGPVPASAGDRPGGAAAPTRNVFSAVPGRDTSNGAGVDGLLGSVRGLITPLGIADRVVGPTPLLTPSSRAATPVPATLDRLLRPVTGPLHAAAAPVSVAVSRTFGPAIGSGPPSAPGGRLPSVRDERAGPVVAAGPVNGDRAAAATATQVVRVTRDQTHSVLRPPAGTELTAAEPPAVGTGTSDVPVRPSSAPMLGWAGSGHTTTGSSVPAEGGAYAVSGTSVTGGTAALRRLPAPADVEVMRLDAEAPTVSPD